MKRILALLLCLTLLLPVLAFAEEEDVDLADLVSEDVELQLDDEGNIVLPEENDEIDLNAADEGPFAEMAAENAVDDQELEINENLPEEDVVNILLIGLDYRTQKRSADQLLKDQLGDNNDHVKRSDVVMILSVDRIEGTLKLTSIARDLLVEIPGHSDGAINTAFAVRKFKNGSFHHSEDRPDLLMRTVNHNFELNIKYYIATNFYGVEEIIEYFGGVDVDLTKTEANYINSYIRQKRSRMTYDQHADNRTPLEKKDGVQHLDGLQGLIFARTRSIAGENDLQRTGRTRRLLEALLHPVAEKIKNGELDPVNMMLDLSQYFVTNMNLQVMFNELWPAVRDSSIMSSLDSASSLIEENRIPGESGFRYNGSKVQLTNKQQTVEELHEFIYGAYYSADN